VRIKEPTLRIPISVLNRILGHAVADYPMECCGLLVGQGDEVHSAVAVRNLYAGECYDRFELDPVDHVRVWEAARAAGDSIVGCYHSHPDGMALPSSIDRRLARRFGGPFGYLVVAIGESQASGIFAGMISEDGEIVPVALEPEGQRKGG
jgi:proteasome lid subunit RPN8/RPN11